jgi:chromosome segregation ATPase
MRNEIILTTLILGLSFTCLKLLEAKTEAEVQLQNAMSVVSSYEQAIEDLTKQNVELSARNAEATLDFTEAKRELEGLKNREQTVLARRTWVEKKINKAFTKSQTELACQTGDTKLCSEN